MRGTCLIGRTVSRWIRRSGAGTGNATLRVGSPIVHRGQGFPPLRKGNLHWPRSAGSNYKRKPVVRAIQSAVSRTAISLMPPAIASCTNLHRWPDSEQNSNNSANSDPAQAKQESRWGRRRPGGGLTRCVRTGCHGAGLWPDRRGELVIPGSNPGGPLDLRRKSARG